MSASFENKNSESQNSILTRMAQDPISFIEKNHQKGCATAIDFLRKVRREISEDNDLSIDNPDQTFKDFYISDDNTMKHYLALVTLLRRGGFDKISVQEAFIDNAPSGAVNTSKSEAVQLYIQLTEESVSKIYGE